MSYVGATESYNAYPVKVSQFTSLH